MAAAEIKRFADRFGLLELLDKEGHAYADQGLKYLRVTESELLVKIAGEPRLLKLPLVRSGNRLAVGHDEDTWKTWLNAT